MDIVKITVNVGNTSDAELQAIQGIPQLLKALPPKRKIAVLSYLQGRIFSGDCFGEDWSDNDE